MKLTIAQALLRAIAAHKAGELQDAERLYGAILQSQPRHAHANQGLGVLELSAGTTEIALPLLKTALEANPTQGEFWIRYIDTLIRTNRIGIASRVWRQGKAIGLKGDAVDAFGQRLLRPAIRPASQASGEPPVSTPTANSDSRNQGQLTGKASGPTR